MPEIMPPYGLVEIELLTRVIYRFGAGPVDSSSGVVQTQEISFRLILSQSGN
jgi:hypothetical protein